MTDSLLSVIMQVMVEIPQGFKFATVKFIGETEFAVGEWIGVAFDRPYGKLECYSVGWGILNVSHGLRVPVGYPNSHPHLISLSHVSIHFYSLSLPT